MRKINSAPGYSSSFESFAILVIIVGGFFCIIAGPRQ